jgi:hypothetical protein
LNGALFVERSGTKKREWKAEKGAQIKKLFPDALWFFLLILGIIRINRFMGSDVELVV